MHHVRSAALGAEALGLVALQRLLGRAGGQQLTSAGNGGVAGQVPSRIETAQKHGIAVQLGVQTAAAVQILHVELAYAGQRIGFQQLAVQQLINILIGKEHIAVYKTIVLVIVGQAVHTLFVSAQKGGDHRLVGLW